jgi:hypothetical protein
MDVTQGMRSATEVTPMVYERITDTASYSQGELSLSEIKDRNNAYGFLQGPR